MSRKRGLTLLATQRNAIARGFLPVPGLDSGPARAGRWRRHTTDRPSVPHPDRRTPGMSEGAARSGTLHITKECSEHTGAAGAFCTVTASSFAAIPIGSKVVYAEALMADGGIDSDIVVNTPNGDV